MTGQQVSTASANAIWGCVTAAVSPMEAQQFLAAPDDRLRAAGLSRTKVETLRRVAEAMTSGEIAEEALAGLSSDVVRERLCAIKGIGPWTADVYLMFGLRRADGFAAGDLALQVAAQRLLSLDERPTAKALSAIAAERWRPWRSVAARLLWAYYAEVKGGSSTAGLPTG